MTATATNLKAALKDIAETFGNGSVVRLNDYQPEPYDAVSTGCSALDTALGIGGLPRGVVTEMFGPEGAGKTTVALHVIASAQASGLVCAFIDTENALDLTYAQAIGVDVPALLLAQPHTAEEALEVAHRLIVSGDVGVVVIDSIAALLPLAELQGEMGEATVGLKARLIGQAMRKLVPAARTNNTLLLCVNQNREAIGVMFGSPIVQPGGKAIKYAACVRLEVKRGQPAPARKGAAGAHKVEVKFKVVKNKAAAPFREAAAWIEFGKGLVDKQK